MMSTIEECPFCNIKERVLKENEHAVLILSDPRKVEGHFLVIPKRHVEKPWEMSEEERKDVFGLLLWIQQKIGERLEGCDIRENYRPFMKQDRIKVDHIHYHAYPRSWQDELYDRSEKYEIEMFTALDDGERQRVIKLILGSES